MVEYRLIFKKEIQSFYDKYLDIKNSLSANISGSYDRKYQAQLIINRVFFLYLLQKSNLLNNDPHYLKNLYNQAIGQRVSFYKHYLIILFTDVLNREHDNAKSITISNINFGRVPYLNGSLFLLLENEHSIDIKNDVWEMVWGFLEQYEWSIEEDQANSFTITPTILGFIYEKSVIAENESDKVSYYTPIDIAENITKTTIGRFLSSRIKNRFGIEIKNIEKFLSSEDFSKEERVIIKYLSELIKGIKILDNACGSGAFLVVAEKTILNYSHLCWNALNTGKSQDHFDVVSVKKHILTNNIYGVDIQMEAVEIAKLRLWMSLIAEEVKRNQITPLPNIDYNIRQGNSLIGLYELPSEEQLELSSFNKDSYSDDLTKRVLERKSKLLQKYKYITHTEEKSKVKQEIDEITSDLKSKLDRKLLLKFRDKKIMINLKELEKLSPFHWAIEFCEVFYNSDDVRKGFDVIIGNPPYGNVLSQYEKEYLSQYFETAVGKEGSNNAASVFIEASYYTLNDEGTFGMIVPNTICRKDKFIKIRNFILQKAYLYTIIDEENAFKDSNVSLEMVSIFFQKVLLDKDYDVEIISKREESKKFRVRKSIFEKYGWFVLYFDSLMEELYNNSQHLGKFGHFASAERPSALKVNLNSQGDILVVKGEGIKNYYIKSDLMVKRNQQVMNYVSSLKYPLLILPEISNYVKASICEKGVIPISGVMIWEPYSDMKGLKEILLILLNSGTISYYFHNYILNKSKLTTHLDSTYLERLPFNLPNNFKLYENLAKIMTHLGRHIKTENVNGTSRAESLYCDIFKLLQEEVINPLIYNLFFRISSDFDEKSAKAFDEFSLSTTGLQTLKDKVAKIPNEKIKGHKYYRLIHAN